MIQRVKEDSKARVNTICPYCNLEIHANLGEHIKSEHGEESYRAAVLMAKESGTPDPKIGELFNINFKQLEKIITAAYGVNISILKKPKKVTYWAPKDFQEETTTVWSFRRRGAWATHDGRYRGNWSPYIPRNVILKYSKAGDTVLDYFVGGGTTAIEAKLLGRKCIARDINPAAIGLTLDNLRFEPPTSLFSNRPMFEPQVSVGDARELSDIEKGSIDLICAHPPYAGIITYSSKVAGDLSSLNYEEFIEQMRAVAAESYRVLKAGGKCAILIGDTRKKKHVIPIGFRTIGIFLSAGFQLKELVIKRQHHCRMTGFWYKSSIRNNFLLLAHEYLAVFERPKSSGPVDIVRTRCDAPTLSSTEKPPPKEKPSLLETTSVWILPDDKYDEYLTKNVVERYSDSANYLEVSVDKEEQEQLTPDVARSSKVGLLFVRSPYLDDNTCAIEAGLYIDGVHSIVEQGIQYVNRPGFLVIQSRDVRIDCYVEPLAKKLVDKLDSSSLWLKEIIVLTKNCGCNSAANNGNPTSDLTVTHQYLLVYEVLGEELSRSPTT